MVSSGVAPHGILLGCSLVVILAIYTTGPTPIDPLSSGLVSEIGCVPGCLRRSALGLFG